MSLTTHSGEYKLLFISSSRRLVVSSSRRHSLFAPLLSPLRLLIPAGNSPISQKMDVHLLIYDLSGGMARQMSMSLLGFQLDAVYHTSIKRGGRGGGGGGGGGAGGPGAARRGRPGRRRRRGR